MKGYAVSFYQNASVSCDIEILVALPDGERGIRPEKFVAEDLG
jgi:hypothetical protein